MPEVHQQGYDMDIDDYTRQVQPRAKRSRLEPYRQQIFDLKAKGYANWQVRDWLATVGVTCTQEAVRKFIKSREGKPMPAALGQPASSPNLDTSKTETPPTNDTAAGASQPAPRKQITNPADIRKARNRPVDLESLESNDDKE
jgi:hypothetical protein